MGSSDAAAAPGAGESAIQTALQQVRQNPRDFRAYQQLSAAYAGDRQADDLALAAALQAIALEPKAPEAYLQAAAVYRHWNQPQRSKAILLRCIEHCPSSHDAHLMLAKAYRQLHDLDHFDAAIERCLAIQPGSLAALNERAALERNQGNWEPAGFVAPPDCPTSLQWFEAPLTRPEHRPRAWRLETSLAQVYELPALLSHEECQQVIDAINASLTPSKVTRGVSYDRRRTSRTASLRRNHPELSASLDQRFAALFGVDPRLSEPIQVQRYDAGEYFKEHNDWFSPRKEDYATQTDIGGQRTWTVMVYLNAVERGGETLFSRLGRSFTPVPGLALAWNNLQADGTPNPFTLHEALPVQAGHKWIITKWFRADFGRNG